MKRKRRTNGAAAARGTPRLDFYRDRKGQGRWRLKAGNGKVLADGVEGYADLHNARRAARRLWDIWRSVGRP